MKKTENKRVIVMLAVGAVLLVAVLAFRMLGSKGSNSAATTPPVTTAPAAAAPAASAPATPGVAVAAGPRPTTVTTLPTSGAPRDPFAP